MDTPKTAEELVRIQVEPGDTTVQPLPPIFDASAPREAGTDDNTVEYLNTLEANRIAHETAQKIEGPFHRVYKSTMDTAYIFKDGSIAIFRGKRYLTDNAIEIAELDFEIIKKKNPYLFIDPEEKEADPKLEDPTERLKAKLFAEWAAQVERAMNPGQDAGKTETQKLTPASSTTIAAVAAGGGPNQSVTTQMANLLAKIRGNK